jgi:hypothetical protein
MELKYTPRTIASIEDVTKRPITEIVGEFSMRNIVLLVSKGLDKNEDETYTLLEEYFQTGDMVALYVEIIEALKNGGFLPRTLNLDSLKETLNKEIKV